MKSQPSQYVPQAQTTRVIMQPQPNQRLPSPTNPQEDLNSQACEPGTETYIIHHYECMNPCWFLFWILIFLIPAFPIAIICGLLYIILFLFVPCWDVCVDLTDFLLLGVQLPAFSLNCALLCRNPCKSDLLG